jgi:Flp pilus assembly protein TadG
MAMTRHACDGSTDKGFVVVYVAVTVTALLLLCGLALDAGRAYLVKAQLTKAVDGAALAAARMLNSGDPEGAATEIFRANFPAGLMGTSAVSDPPDFDLQVIPSEGVNVITITGSATLPTTLMRLATFDEVTVRSSAEATRRMVDLSLVLDVSSSLGSRWSAVRDAARVFVDSFDAAHDRLALVTYSDGARVRDPMSADRGFDKAQVMSDIPDALPGGSTAMIEGLYRGWDELRSVPGGQQSGIRVIVLFTDGASNSLPGHYPAAPGIAKGLRSYDFPKNFPDPDNQTHASPTITGLFDTETGARAPVLSLTVPWNSTQTHPQAPFLPSMTWHAHGRSAGIPSAFPLQTSALTVDGAPQSSQRGLRNWDAVAGAYPADVWNINNASRNVLEIVADAARNDEGDYGIRIYTIGMGELVRYSLGTMPEMPEEILMRIANDPASSDFNSGQLAGRYYFARTDADVGPAFQALQNQIIRLSK